ncbi:MAG: AraC family transcriptional regulator [Myxococcales bacterium]|jgi:AraC-like DNA-binding protein|nr:AraC family transcriptional regulator [Myxococcales bacterium]MCG5052857.1 AraC family transcriptional regulator [Myxococcales bacterium]
MRPGNRFRFQYSTASQLGRITEAGLIRNSQGPHEWRTLGHYALVYSLSGGAQYRDRNGIHQDIDPGDVILLFPDLPHAYGPKPGQTWSEFYLIFDGPVFDLWRAKGILDPTAPKHHAHPVDVWLRRLEQVVQRARKPGLTLPLLEVCRLQDVLAEIVTGGAAAARGQGPLPEIARACALLASDVDQSVDLADLAREMGMSYETFRKKFVQVVGVPPARYRSARLLERACELIRHGHMTDKEIALELGFCDEFHFSRRFKQIIGVPPRSYRRKMSRTA